MTTSGGSARVGTASVAALTAAIALSGCGQATGPSDSRPGPETVATTSAGTGPAGAALAPHNDADTAFAALMLTHHAQSVAMTDIVLAKDGLDPEIVELATATRATRTAEIEQLGEWRAAWGEPATSESAMDMDHMGHTGMSMGVLSLEEMAELEDATAEQGATIYLTYMLESHRHAIEMALTEMTEGANPVAVELAAEMIRGHTSELAEMQRLLDD